MRSSRTDVSVMAYASQLERFAVDVRKVFDVRHELIVHYSRTGVKYIIPIF